MSVFKTRVFAHLSPFTKPPFCFLSKFFETQKPGILKPIRFDTPSGAAEEAPNGCTFFFKGCKTQSRKRRKRFCATKDTWVYSKRLFPHTKKGTFAPNKVIFAPRSCDFCTPKLWFLHHKHDFCTPKLGFCTRNWDLALDFCTLNNEFLHPKTVNISQKNNIFALDARLRSPRSLDSALAAWRFEAPPLWPQQHKFSRKWGLVSVSNAPILEGGVGFPLPLSPWALSSALGNQNKRVPKCHPKTNYHSWFLTS